MKRRILSILSVALLLVMSILPVGAISKADINQIDQKIASVEAQIAEQKKVLSSFSGDTTTILLAQIVSTTPQFIVKGAGFGISAIMTDTQYYVVTDPSAGVSEYGMFSGTFMVTGMTQIRDGGYTYSAQIVSPLPAKYTAASEKISQLNKDLESLKKQKSSLEKQLEEQRMVPPEWAKATVQAAIARGFVPTSLQSDYGEPITRQEFCQLLVQTINAKLENVPGETKYLAGATYKLFDPVSFTDTSDPSVLLLAKEGIVNGSGNGTFSPNQSLTRQQAATILTRCIHRLGIGVETGSRSTYSDRASIADYAQDSVGYLSACESNGTKIMGGVGNDLFSPNGSYTRAQAIVTLCRLADYVTDSGVSALQKQLNSKNPLHQYANLTESEKADLLKQGFEQTDFETGMVSRHYQTDEGTVYAILFPNYDGSYGIYVFGDLDATVDELSIQGNEATGKYKNSDGDTGRLVFTFGENCYLTIIQEKPGGTESVLLDRTLIKPSFAFG